MRHRIVAVVLNWCAEDDSARSITALRTHAGALVDVLLVDNASPDGSGARLAHRFPDVPVLHADANRGYAGGNELAIQWALARGYGFILLVNDDAEVEQACVERLVAVMDAEPRVAAAAPTVVFGPPHEDRVWWGGGALAWHRTSAVHGFAGQSVEAIAAVAGPSVPVDCLCGCVLLLRADALRQLGGLRTEFFSYGEDVELSIRLSRGGWGLRWVPAARARHHLPFPEAPPSPWAIRQRDRNRRRVAALHLGRRDRLVFWVWFASTRLLRWGGYVLTGDVERARAIWAGLTSR